MTQAQKIKWYKSAWRGAVVTLCSIAKCRDANLCNWQASAYLMSFDADRIHQIVKEETECETRHKKSRLHKRPIRN